MNTPTHEPLLLKLRDAAELLQVSDRTLWQLSKDGDIPSIRVGVRSVRYCRKQLQEWIEQQKAGQSGGGAK